jgi:hypothetical protein
MLLLWVFPPPIGDNELRALGRFARLFASLESQQDQVRSLRDEVMMKDQAAAMGHVMQHFRHRLVNEIGAMNGLVELMESDVQKHDCEAISRSLTRLKIAAQKPQTPSTRRGPTSRFQSPSPATSIVFSIKPGMICRIGYRLFPCRTTRSHNPRLAGQIRSSPA